MAAKQAKKRGKDKKKEKKKEKKKADALRMRTATPVFTVNDIERSLAWYRDVLGFAVKERWENSGKLEGVDIVAGKVSFMLTQDDWKKGRDRLKGQGVRIYCTTGQDIDRLAERVKSKGGALTREPTDEWGMRSLSVDDPDGYKLTIASKLKA